MRAGPRERERGGRGQERGSRGERRGDGEREGVLEKKEWSIWERGR